MTKGDHRHKLNGASSPAEPWADAGLTVTPDGTNLMVTVPPDAEHLFYRLVTN